MTNLSAFGAEACATLRAPTNGNTEAPLTPMVFKCLNCAPTPRRLAKRKRQVMFLSAYGWSSDTRLCIARSKEGPELSSSKFQNPNPRATVCLTNSQKHGPRETDRNVHAWDSTQVWGWMATHWRAANISPSGEQAGGQLNDVQCIPPNCTEDKLRNSSKQSGPTSACQATLAASATLARVPSGKTTAPTLPPPTKQSIRFSGTQALRRLPRCNPCARCPWASRWWGASPPSTSKWC